MTKSVDHDGQSEPAALDPRVQYLFEVEILDQWQFIRRAGNVLDHELGKEDWANLDSGAFWFAIEAMLGALANISKVFFPMRRASAQVEQRCKLMREAFGVPDDSILKDRAIRDAFQHFDERIERWDRQSLRHNVISRVLGPAGSVSADIGDTFRHYDPATAVISVMGREQLNLKGLYDEVGGVIERVAAYHERVPWAERHALAEDDSD